MMNNLFFMFDPSSSEYMLFTNWMFFIFIILFMPIFFWLIPSRMNILLYLQLFWFIKEFNLLFKKNMKFNFIMFNSLFMIIFISNLYSLIPYIFTFTSHMWFNLTLSLILWFKLMLFSWTYNYNYMFAHMIPQNTPILLINFMVLIETISNLIRPITLSIRLTANMIAGHLILSLLSSCILSLKLYLYMFLIEAMMLLLEIMVAMIQAYVFTILMILYYNESISN